MTAPVATGPAVPGDTDTPLLQARGLSKMFGTVISLTDMSLTVRAGEVTCVLGDNGAGKSTLIKILSGVHPPDTGEILIDGVQTRFSSPRDAREAGIATVYQDLAMVPLMAVWRNFFLGSEPTKGWGLFRRFDADKARTMTRSALAEMGIDIRDADQVVGTLSGGERQSVAIARAVHFGARLLILDEPTSALGVKQAGVVLRYVLQAKDKGLGVIFTTHNPHHYRNRAPAAAGGGSGRHPGPHTAGAGDGQRRRGHRRGVHHGRLWLRSPLRAGRRAGHNAAG
jgi:simple sugar transport system ATP-binding protein